MSGPALAWDVAGPADAPVLLLLNSVGASTAMWDPVVALLVEELRILRVDWPGHGRAPALPGRPPGQGVGLDDLGQGVLDVLDNLAISRAHVAGVSLGGMVGMWLAANHPERVSRLALICTSAHLPPARGWQERAARVRAGEVEAVADTVIARWLTEPCAAADPGLVQSLRAMFLAVDPESYAQCCEAIGAMDLRPDLRRITAPTLVVAGAQDPATPVEHALTIVAAVAGARLQVLDPAAHLAVVERPDQVAGLLLTHLLEPTPVGAYAGPVDDDARRALGQETRRAILGDAHVDRAAAGTTPFTAPFQDFITRYAWGEIWPRPGLARRERSIATLAALVALGAEHEIAMHVRAALRNGLTEQEILEVLLHTGVYAGVPRANRAFAIAAEVLAEG